MRGARKITFIRLLAVATLVVQNAGAARGGVVAYYSPSTMFDVVSTSVTVDCKVNKDASDLFADIGRMSDREFAAGLSFSAEQIWEGVNPWSPSVNDDPIYGYVDSVSWTVTGSPVQSLDFLFADVTDGGEQSTLLQFASDRRAISERRYVSRLECMNNGRFTCTDVGAGVAHAGWGDWGMDF